MKRRLLDLFCGAGGAGTGYARAGFDVTGVDDKPQRRYPYNFMEMDALLYLICHGAEYDLIHASPPCQRYSVCTPHAFKDRHPDLIKTVRRELKATKRVYVIENVEGARRELYRPLMLCGSMFGLGVRRHRWFEISVSLPALRPCCNHSRRPVIVTGRPGKSNNGGKEPTVNEMRRAMGIDWMVRRELDQAIPPAYTQYLGNLLMEYLDKEDLRNVQ